jgi:hypothetical protein
MAGLSESSVLPKQICVSALKEHFSYIISVLLSESMVTLNRNKAGTLLQVHCKIIALLRQM